MSRPVRLRIISCLLFSLSAALIAGAACYHPPAVQRLQTAKIDFGQLGYDALENHAGAVMVIDPQYGRIIRRVSRGADVQFSSSPFELAQVVTAYAALDKGLINERTLLPCNGAGEQTDLAGALAHPCPAFFAELSRRLTPAAFRSAAELIGFTYYGIESRKEGLSALRPFSAAIPAAVTGADFEALAARGVGMQASDLHFAQLVSSLASGATASERFAASAAASLQGVAPPATPLNRRALAALRRGLVQAVDEGSAKAAANIDHQVAGKMGSSESAAIFISYAPAEAPRIGLVVYLKEATGRDAAEVAGKFYRAYFAK